MTRTRRSPAPQCGCQRPPNCCPGFTPVLTACSLAFRRRASPGASQTGATWTLSFHPKSAPPAGLRVAAALTRPRLRSSLCYDWSAAEQGSEHADGVTELWHEVVWRRPAEILERSETVASGAVAKVFAGGVEPDDINQGELGDCYLLSALSVLAEVDGSVQQLFVAHKQNDSHGVYVVRLCVRGHWREIILDEMVPCFPDSQSRGQPVFSRGKGAELWVMLLEKAWAKVFGSYQSIVSGLPGEALTTLTGAPCTFVPHGESTLWAKVYEATTNDPSFKAKNWFVVALLPEDPEYDLEELGLVAGHAYGVLDARQVTMPGAPPVQLLQLRNPWGSFEWTGAFGAGSAEWTPQVRAQLSDVNPDAKEDGSFWMTVQDFGKYFAGVQICRASRGWKETSEDVHAKPGKVSVLTLTVHGAQPVTLDLTLHQTDRRMHRATPDFDDNSFEYLGVRMMVVQAETSEVVQHWPLTQQRDVWVEVKHLAPGKYWVLVETDYDGSARPDAEPCSKGGQKVVLGVSTLSDGDVELLAPHHCEGLNGALLKEAALRHMCSAAQAPADILTYDMLFPTAARHTCKISKSYYAMRDTFCWFYSNTSHKLRLTERMNMSLENVVIDGEADGVTDATIVVEPGQTKLFVIRQRKGGLPIKWFAKPEARVEEFDVGTE